MTALDAKSPYTAGHSKSVSDMVEILCRLLSLNRMMHIAAHLHDIGKIGIPDSILLKESKLSDEEYVQAVKDRVHDYGKEGRYIAWYRENNPERREKGYETMYTESRKFYCD